MEFFLFNLKLLLLSFYMRLGLYSLSCFSLIRTWLSSKRSLTRFLCNLWTELGVLWSLILRFIKKRNSDICIWRKPSSTHIKTYKVTHNTIAQILILSWGNPTKDNVAKHPNSETSITVVRLEKRRALLLDSNDWTKTLYLYWAVCFNTQYREISSPWTFFSAVFSLFNFCREQMCLSYEKIQSVHHWKLQVLFGG